MLATSGACCLVLTTSERESDIQEQVTRMVSGLIKRMHVEHRVIFEVLC